MIDLSTCPLLSLPVWDREALAVAADWAMAHGVRSAAEWMHRPKKYTPELVRLALSLNIDPADLRMDRFATGYIVYGGLLAVIGHEDYYAMGVDLLADDTRCIMLADCAKFQRDNADDLAEWKRLRQQTLARDRRAAGRSQRFMMIDWSFVAGEEFWHARNGMPTFVDDLYRRYDDGGRYFETQGFVYAARDERAHPVELKLNRAARQYPPLRLFIDADGLIHHYYDSVRFSAIPPRED